MIFKLYKKFAAALIFLTISLMTAVYIFGNLLPSEFYCENGLNFSSSYGRFIKFENNSNVAKEVLSEQNSTSFSTAKLLGVFPIKEITVTVTDEKIVKVCGTPFGVKMFADGVIIVGFSQIDTKNGKCCPGSEAGLLKGDVIKAIDGEEVFANEDVAEKIEGCDGKSISITVERSGAEMTFSVTPKMLSESGVYKAGFWVRDSSAGIGTLTFYDPESLVFAGLGHAVCDIETGMIIPFSSGEIVPASITKINKGKPGAPGELGGTFTSTENLGIVKINNETGLYGVLEYEIEGLSTPIAHKQEIYEGPAVILSTIDGTKAKEYDIVIEKISLSDDSNTKNMVIRVTDEELIEATGGIVQGMSGSPIIQDGKLIGAVTHVFVNDPTKGYGIFIENMLEAVG